jgi:hypothetical protein
MKPLQGAVQRPAKSSLRLVLLRIHNAVLLDLRLVVAVHRRHELENGRGASASEALDDVCNDELAIILSPLKASHVHEPDAARMTSHLLYSCVMVPLASMMAFFAASTTLSGVSLGQLIMTDFWGAAAMAKAARSATKSAVSAKRILASVCDRSGERYVSAESGGRGFLCAWDVKGFRLSDCVQLYV